MEFTQQNNLQDDPWVTGPSAGQSSNGATYGSIDDSWSGPSGWSG